MKKKPEIPNKKLFTKYKIGIIGEMPYRLKSKKSDNTYMKIRYNNMKKTLFLFILQHNKKKLTCGNLYF